MRISSSKGTTSLASQPGHALAFVDFEFEGSELRRRVLVFAAGESDADRTKAILNDANIMSHICPDIESLRHETSAGAGAIVATEEALDEGTQAMVVDVLSQQPSWSDLPILVLTRPQAQSTIAEGEALRLGNVVLLERPVPVAMLVSAVRFALRARGHQYEQRELMAAKSLLAAIVEGSDDAIISKRLDGTIVSWNAAAERLFGYAADEAIGQPMTLIIPPDRLDEERMILERLRRGERLDHFETVRVAKSGRLIDLSLTVSPVRDSSNAIVGASKVARDISDRRQIETALRDADRRKDEFLATLAHELRNPLAPIRNSLHILRVTSSTDHAVTRVREILERQVNHMVRLVDDLLDISRITRGKIELRREATELAAAIGSAVETSKPLIDAAGQDLVLNISPEPMPLMADPVRLAQVFSNLLNNASKYSDARATIWVRARPVDGEVVVSVRDSGVGIAPEMLPRVFDMFEQAATALPRARGGLGIGLTLVRSLVQLHGGTVDAQSAGIGQGSEFIVRLPLSPVERAVPSTGTTDEHAAGLVDLRILVVDDHRDAADSLGNM
ncbi:MAG: PAS domain-containing sensor histidine kinase, partial [Gemmatimonadaceae bacterium]